MTAAEKTQLLKAFLTERKKKKNAKHGDFIAGRNRQYLKKNLIIQEM